MTQFHGENNPNTHARPRSKMPWVSTNTYLHKDSTQAFSDEIEVDEYYSSFEDLRVGVGVFTVGTSSAVTGVTSGICDGGPSS